MLLSVLGSCRDSRVIDEEDMSKIYAEMLMTDQWINSTPDVRRIADTSLVYEPILRKYGYTSEDYRYSINYYLDHDDDFADIMKGTIRILDARKAALELKRTMLEEEKKVKQYINEVAKGISIHESIYAYNNPVAEKAGPDDSLTVYWDTLALCFKINWLSQIDSLAAADSVSGADSIKIPKFLARSSAPLKMDTLRPVIDTSKTIVKPSDMRPIKSVKPFEGQELKAVKDAYILN